MSAVFFCCTMSNWRHLLVNVGGERAADLGFETDSRPPRRSLSWGCDASQGAKAMHAGLGGPIEATQSGIGCSLVTKIMKSGVGGHCS